jgi:hypothetical protein
MNRWMFALAVMVAGASLSQAQQPQQMMPPGYGYGMPGYGQMAPGYGQMPAGYGPQAGGVMPAGFMQNLHAGQAPAGGCATGNCGDAGGYGYGHGGAGNGESSRFGFHPVIKRLFHIKNDPGNCGNGNCGGKNGVGPNGAQMGPGGTLVFPHQPFVRSPRDFFEK